MVNVCLSIQNTHAHRAYMGLYILFDKKMKNKPTYSCPQQYYVKQQDRFASLSNNIYIAVDTTPHFENYLKN